MSTNPPSMIQALEAIQRFMGPNLTGRIGSLENAMRGRDGTQCVSESELHGVTSDLLAAAYAVKLAAAQIDVVIHAVGGLMLIPKILEPGETIQALSLGAGNTGRDFDLETDRRVAEFKFIHWKGGPESIRKNNLFKDFFLLAEHPTPKCKELYVLDTTLPLKAMRGGRSLKSVLSKNVKLWEAFKLKYGDAYKTVGDYYADHQHKVAIRDAAPMIPQLVQIVDAVPETGDGP